MSDPRTSIIAYSSAGSAVLFGFTANEFAALMGLLFAFGTFLINWYYKHKHLKLIEKKVARLPFAPSLGEDDS